MRIPNFRCIFNRGKYTLTNAVLLACCEAPFRALMIAYKVLLAFLKVWSICSLYDNELWTNTPRYVKVSVDASAIFSEL